MGEFGRNRSGRSRSFGKRDFGGNRFNRERPQMFDAICSNCGKECQVPFKPTGEKPVYCRECFAKMNGGESRGNFDRNNRNERPMRAPANDQQLREVNEKLDKILALLHTKLEEITEKPQENDK